MANEDQTRYPLSHNELGILLQTIEWMNQHLSEIIALLNSRASDEELIKIARSAHSQLTALLDRLERHHAAVGKQSALRPLQKLFGTDRTEHT